MSKDELTPNPPDDEEDGKETKPTITAVFRLLRDVESRVNARLDEVESRLARDIEALDSRVTEGFKDLGHKINALNRRSLQSEADYQDLAERLGRLESNAS
jgi:predicted  nucleic acid-binding Zn-ribbon protein